MKILLIAVVVTASAVAQDKPLALPSACGPKHVSFDVKLADAPQSVTQPDPVKATVFFIEDNGPMGNHQQYTIKIGLDGAWVGAYQHNAYFAVSVEPGEHHICAKVQSRFLAGHNLALLHFEAVAGKVYFFRTQFLAGLTTMYPSAPFLELNRLDSDQANYLISTFPRSVSQPKQ